METAAVDTTGCTSVDSSDAGSAGAGGSEAGDGGGGQDAAGGLGGDGGTGESDAGVDAATTCAPPNHPEAIPADWELHESWSCNCPMFTPPEGVAPLPPLGWTSCAPFQPDGFGCEQLALQLDGAEARLVPDAVLSSDTQGAGALIHLLLDQQNGGDTVRFSLVIDGVTGAIRHAIGHAQTPRCDFGPPSIAADGYAVALAGGIGPGAQGREEEGIVGGLVGVVVPEISLRLPADPDQVSSWLVTPQWVVRNASDITAWTWDLKTHATIVSAAGTTDADLSAVAGAGGHLFLESLAHGRAGVAVWSLKTGVQPLLGGDPLGDSAGEFSTDQIDMVWTRIPRKTSDGGGLSPWFMTAPLSTNVAEIESTARRLLDHADQQGQGRWSVGCGRAARVGPTGAEGIPSLVVVDLADGAVTQVAFPSKPGLEWIRVVGLTCPSIYVIVRWSGVDNLWKLSTEGTTDAGIDADSDAENDAP